MNKDCSGGQWPHLPGVFKVLVLIQYGVRAEGETVVRNGETKFEEISYCV